MAQQTFAERINDLKANLLSVPQEKLVAALVERCNYDQSLFKFLEVLGQLHGSGAKPDKSFEQVKNFLKSVYGARDPEKRDHHDLQEDVHSVQAAVELLFANGLYSEVIQLFEESLQYEENLACIHWPDDFLDTAYMPLAMLCLRSHLKLGKSPEEAAAIFQKMGEADQYGLFGRLHYMRPQDDEAVELAPVRKVLEKGKL